MCAKASSRGEALLVDDEPEYLEWVREYLEVHGVDTALARNVPEAFEQLGRKSKEFIVILVDMNIPPLGAVTPDMLKRAPLVERYPGIAVAYRARNLGYGAHQVIGYTVHDDDLADTELAKLNCRYVLKGRPEALKSVLQKSFAPRPPSQKKKR